jgi:guanylate kinase
MERARDEMAHVDEYTYAVVNDRFEAALDTLAAIVLAERHRADRQQARIAALLAAQA